MSKPDANQRHYFSPLKSRNEIIEHLQKFKKGLKFLMWKEGDENLEKFLLESFQSEPPKLFFKYEAGLLNKLKGCPLNNKKVLFKASFNGYQYFSTSVLRSNKETKIYEVLIDSEVYLAQQRQNYRLFVDETIRVKLIWEEHEFQVQDVSAGGVSLVLTQDEAKLLEDLEDNILHNCFLVIKNLKCQIPIVQIVKSWEDENVEDGKPSDKYFGCKFEKMKSTIEERLTSLINSEARGIEIRKMLEDRKKKK